MFFPSKQKSCQWNKKEKNKQTSSCCSMDFSKKSQKFRLLFSFIIFCHLGLSVAYVGCCVLWGFVVYFWVDRCRRKDCYRGQSINLLFSICLFLKFSFVIAISLLMRFITVNRFWCFKIRAYIFHQSVFAIHFLLQEHTLSMTCLTLSFYTSP